MCVTIPSGVAFMRYGPQKEEPPSLIFSVPLAMIGFVVAATWIDLIADQLVNLLNFLGIVCHIPATVMGLTVLAWGNSIGDLSTNMSMAKRGLGNMAITACFAGPLFNLLVGLGVGFSLAFNKFGVDEIYVELPSTIMVGFCFLLLNCVTVLFAGTVLNVNSIDRRFAYFGVALYIGYVVTSVTVAFAYP